MKPWINAHEVVDKCTRGRKWNKGVYLDVNLTFQNYKDATKKTAGSRVSFPSVVFINKKLSTLKSVWVVHNWSLTCTLSDLQQFFFLLEHGNHASCQILPINICILYVINLPSHRFWNSNVQLELRHCKELSFCLGFLLLFHKSSHSRFKLLSSQCYSLDTIFKAKNLRVLILVH